MSLLKFSIKHFKTISFFGGFVLDVIFLPKTTSPYYIWIGPIDIGVLLFVLIIRQLIKRNLVKRTKKIRKAVKDSETGERKTFEELKTKGYNRVEKVTGWTTYAFSFFLGTLLSHTLVYYFRSSDILQVWPIFAIVIFAIIANEFFLGIFSDIVLFYIGLTFYVIFNVPILLNQVNTYTFFLSILSAVILTSILTMFLQRIYLSKKDFIFLIIFSISFPFLILNLYYANYIPAVPLALGESGFYSNVQKSGKDYLKEEKGEIDKKEFLFFKIEAYDLKSLNNKNLYFYSSIISPADVKARVDNVWEKYNSETKEWVEQFEVNYPISGGREDGYRGYSVNTNIDKGEWRVRVLAEGRLVGLRKVFIY